MIFGANLGFEKTKAPNGEWLASSLTAIYAAHKGRVGEVTVRALTPEKVEINTLNGVLRTLELQDGTWRLASVVSKGGKTPGEVAAILAHP